MSSHDLEVVLRARLLAAAKPPAPTDSYVRVGNSLRRVPGSAAPAGKAVARSSAVPAAPARRVVTGAEPSAPAAPSSAAAQPVRHVSMPAVGFESLAGGMVLQRTGTGGKAGASSKAVASSGDAPARLSVDFKRRRERKDEAEAKRATKSVVLCAHFCRHGRCDAEGRECPYEHDLDCVSICQPFLHGLCTDCDGGSGEDSGDFGAVGCPLSHVLAPERLPVCRLFLIGLCVSTACAYPHVHLGNAAPLCAAFASCGYCRNGAHCAQRHELPCADFAERGVCALGEQCKLRCRRRGPLRQ